MYEYLEGTITIITPSYLALDVGGQGFKVYSAKPYSYSQGQHVRLYVEQVVRDNDISLYGFSSSEEKDLFLRLLSVSGIGPKSAMAIMAAENSDSLAQAIENGEVNYLTKFPGVGKKTASQIVLDLKGKLGSFVQQDLFTQDTSQALSDALMALAALGYTQKEIAKIKPKLEKQNCSEADEYVKEGLKLLLKK
ncbi:Holliday junction branch migration protein RuvA [Lactobacillus psittaci]|uniref:Holliday junction branch migration complex subunit RuvA n=1 Tax=Lactobacillus psittaci DSM 15354 TaxID=1122152 RepID=A0A0R1SAB4_9LACO|nr:Holliday junction branch migration protein RuvA [Lactobacillus psittaci]KRL63064.1 Holliday junction DNA helicase RuvA [Lactobacillus psittaci DSM 15354]